MSASRWAAVTSIALLLSLALIGCGPEATAPGYLPPPGGPPPPPPPPATPPSNAPQQPAPAPDPNVGPAPSQQPAPPPGAFSGRHVFVTSESYTGNLVSAGKTSLGRLAGDALCTKLAAAAGLGTGPYVAWLSLMGKPAGERLAGRGPWHLPSGAQAANSPSDRAALAPTLGIDQDELGRVLPQGARVWTGTAADGTSSHNCTNWAMDYDPLGAKIRGVAGVVGATDGTWTDVERLDCLNKAHLICFEL